MSTKVKVRKTSTERLLAVADIVEANDGRWLQEVWVARSFADTIREAAGFGADDMTERDLFLAVNEAHTCGAFGCIAGWSVAMHPKNFSDETSWEEAGSKSLGLDEWNLGLRLFSTHLGGHLRDGVRRRRVAKVLRWLASFDEAERLELGFANCQRIIDGKKPLSSMNSEGCDE